MRTASPAALGVALAVALTATFARSPSPAQALVWPDVADRVDHGLQASDPALRRVAAQELRNLGPARGTALVLRALADTDVDVRVAAAQSAVRLRVVAATELVLPWLGDREPRLRLAACEVARALPTPKAVPQLARALGDSDPSVRAAAADALGAQNAKDSAEAVPALLSKLDDPSPAVRMQIARALSRLGDARAVVPLVGKVQDSVPEVRQAVARVLGELGDGRAAQALLLQLRDNVAEVRVEAITALGRLKADAAVDALVPFVQDRTPALRQAAVTALGRIATRDAVRALVQALGAGDDAGAELERTPVRDALVAAGPSSTPELHALLSGSPPRAAAVGAAWVLGALGAKGEAATIIAAMRRGALPPAAALHALAGAGTEASVPVVLEFTSDSSATVRAEARRAAAALLNPAHPDGRAVEPLAAALRDPRFAADERASVVALLGRTGAPRAAAIIASFVAAKDSALRTAAIDALGTLGPADADATLLEALGDAEPSVRLRAAVALGESGGPRSIELLLARLGSGDEVDRSALLTALGGVLARHASEPATKRLTELLDVAGATERDALVEALGRSKASSALKPLAALATSQDEGDRRSVAAVLAARAGLADGGAAARVLATTLLRDADPSVRAQAAWSLGALGDASSIAPLAALAAAPDTDAAVDATGALARITARIAQPDAAGGALCPLVRDARPYVRANALAGLGLARARCGDGAQARAALEDDASESVRAAAALAVGAAATNGAGGKAAANADDLRALERCASSDRSNVVAERCRAARVAAAEAKGAPAAPTAARTRAVAVYVVPAGAVAPQPRASYALELADGLVRAGTADRRGVAFEPVAPEGELALKRPAALAR